MEIGALIYLFVWVAVIGLILYVLWYGISQIPMPEPMPGVVRGIFVLIVCLIAISLLLQILPAPPIRLFGR